MRSRNIKPGFFTNESLAECQPLARLLFAGLWCMADRDGRLEDRPARIKANILPYDDCSANDLLADLAFKGFIWRYTANGMRLIQIPTFTKHARPHQDERSEGFAPPPEDFPALAENFGRICAESPILNPSSLNPESPIPHAPKSAKAERARLFESFWLSYPKKKAKGDAVKAWEKMEVSPELHGTILAALEKQKQDESWTRDGGRYIPFPASWLNHRRWEDEPTVAVPPSPTETRAERLARLAAEVNE